MSSGSESVRARTSAARFRLGAMLDSLSMLIALVDWFWLS
jgi:hypothetical protein